MESITINASTSIGQHSPKAENRIQKLIIHHGFREIPLLCRFVLHGAFSCATLANSSLVQQLGMSDRSGLLPSISIYAPSPTESHQKATS